MAAEPLDRERRRPVWVALSALFLDTQLQGDDFARIADVLAASGYTEAQLEEILRHEVAPVVGVNLLSVAGEWSGFDEEWLERRIIQRLRGRLFRLHLPWHRMVRHDWEQVRKRLPWHVGGV